MKNSSRHGAPCQPPQPTRIEMQPQPGSRPAWADAVGVLELLDTVHDFTQRAGATDPANELRVFAKELGRQPQNEPGDRPGMPVKPATEQGVLECSFNAPSLFAEGAPEVLSVSHSGSSGNTESDGKTLERRQAFNVVLDPQP